MYFYYEKMTFIALKYTGNALFHFENELTGWQSLAGMRTVMLTGDNPGSARAVGTALGFSASDIFSSVKPAGKQAKIAELQETGCIVAMVGDGINDAAALAQVPFYPVFSLYYIGWNLCEATKI